MGDLLQEFCTYVQRPNDFTDWERLKACVQNTLEHRPECQMCKIELKELFEAMEELLQFWEGPKRKWDAANEHMQQQLRARLLSPTGETQSILLDKVRYTHAHISSKFRNGAHAECRIEDLKERLLKGTLSKDEDSMVLDVVRFHGAYFSLNNRHLDVQKQAHLKLPQTYQADVKSRVCVWPLTKGLKYKPFQGSNAKRDIYDKFFEALSTRDGGRSVSRSRKEVRSGSSSGNRRI